MALPLKYVAMAAGTPKLPTVLNENDSVVPGVVDPPYLIALKQARHRLLILDAFYAIDATFRSIDGIFQFYT